MLLVCVASVLVFNVCLATEGAAGGEECDIRMSDICPLITSPYFYGSDPPSKELGTAIQSFANDIAIECLKNLTACAAGITLGSKNGTFRYQ